MLAQRVSSAVVLQEVTEGTAVPEGGAGAVCVGVGSGRVRGEEWGERLWGQRELGANGPIHGGIKKHGDAALGDVGTVGWVGLDWGSQRSSPVFMIL